MQKSVLSLHISIIPSSPPSGTLYPIFGPISYSLGLILISFALYRFAKFSPSILTVGIAVPAHISMITILFFLLCFTNLLYLASWILALFSFQPQSPNISIFGLAIAPHFGHLG